MARRNITLGVLLSLLAFTMGICTAAAQTVDERGWLLFPRKVKILKDTYNGNYERDVVKNDIFIFQPQVVINDLLATNGGDVLIVTNELFLNAPIDTRVRLRMGPDYWVASPPGAEPNYDHENLGFALTYYEGVSGSLAAFDSLYLWRETYDPKQKRFVYSVGPRPTHAAPPTELPQLPSAQVPLASTKESGHSHDTASPSDGTDAPSDDINWDNVRSGSIRIYATRIHLCDECKKALAFASVLTPTALRRFPELVDKVTVYLGGRNFLNPDPNAFLGDPFDIERAVFLQASGLKGGRGAAGSSYAAPLGKLLDKAGGRSGMPGRGGDAGSIEVHFINTEPNSEEKDLLSRGVLADGGRPAQSSLQRTNSVHGLP
jgi:hypothetical protein